MSHWVRECIDMVKAKTGTSPNGRRWAGELGIIRKDTKAPTAVVKMYLKEYLYRTPTGYVSPTRFRETFKYWDPGIRHRADVDRKLDEEQRARKAERRGEGTPTRLADILEMPK